MMEAPAMSQKNKMKSKKKNKMKSKKKNNAVKVKF
jgi:hypothetical protein